MAVTAASHRVSSAPWQWSHCLQRSHAVQTAWGRRRRRPSARLPAAWALGDSIRKSRGKCSRGLSVVCWLPAPGELLDVHRREHFPEAFVLSSVLLFRGWKGSAAFLKQQLAEVQHYAT